MSPEGRLVFWNPKIPRWIWYHISKENIKEILDKQFKALIKKCIQNCYKYNKQKQFDGAKGCTHEVPMNYPWSTHEGGVPMKFMIMAKRTYILHFILNQSIMRQICEALQIKGQVFIIRKLNWITFFLSYTIHYFCTSVFLENTI